MNNTILICHGPDHEPDSMEQLLNEAGYGTILCDDVGGHSELGDRAIFLILFLQCPDNPDLKLSGMKLATYIPVLVLDTHPAPPVALKETSSAYLIDYLQTSTEPSQLLARIAFLRKVAKVGYERHSYLTHHENFLKWYSRRDSLTGLYNQHHFNRQVSDRFEETVRHGGELSLMLLDIDYFTAINKTYGRSFGDFVLNELAARITSAIRQEDQAFRLSGDECAILLPGLGLKDARIIAQKMRATCESKPFSRNNLERNVTISIGLASLVANHARSHDELVNMAETAMFKAKAEGRNRFCTFTPVAESEFPHDGINSDTIKVAIGRMLDKTRNSTISSLQLLARDIAGASHRHHLERVADYIELFGKRLGLTPPITKTLQNAAILHTSIRRLIHNDLLNKNGTFTCQERDVLRDFPYKLSEIVEIFDYFSQERLVLLTRTENFDGTGYPDGLKGDEIPLGARILGILDAFAAMAADRPHRPSLTPESILMELKSQAGKQFDPHLILLFLEIIEEHHLLDISPDQLATIRKELNATLAEQSP